MAPKWYTISSGGRLWFASDVKPIIDGGYSVEVNPAGVHAFMKTRFAHGDETIFKGDDPTTGEKDEGCPDGC